jgi:hypothetical protein
MYIEPQYRPNLCVDPNNLRALLAQIYIGTFHGKPVAVGADGVMLACVPITLEDEDVTGYVQLEAFAIGRDQWRRYDRKRAASAIHFMLYERTIAYDDGTVIPRHRVSGQYPDYPKLLKDIDLGKPRGVQLEGFGLNPKLLQRAARAIGVGAKRGMAGSGMRQHISGPQMAMLLRPTNETPTSEPPFALLMPMWVRKANEVKAA